MSIATRIEAIEEHIENAYVGLENLGEDLTNVDKNINNIKSSLDNIYSRLPKVSGTGSVISLTPTLKGKMTLEYKGQTSQDGTPTPDTPVPIQSVTGLQNINVIGKNLLPYPYFSGTTTNKGITFTPREDGSVLVNGTATGQSTFALYGNYLEENQKKLTGNYLSGGTNDVRLRAYNHTGSSYTDLGTDTGSGVQINKSTYSKGYIELVVQNGTTINNVIIKPMMLNSLDDTTYEPYNDNTYEVNLGKNLWGGFSNTFTTSGSGITFISNADGTITLKGTATAYASRPYSSDVVNNNWYKTLKAGTYTISCNNIPTGVNLNILDTSGNSLHTGITSSKTFTLNNDTTIYIRAGVANGTVLGDSGITIKPMIKKGSQATSYSPYFTPIELNKIGDYQDSIKKSTGKNLFSSEIELGNITGTGAKEDSTTRCRTKDFISIKPNTTYSLWNNKSQTYNLYFYDENKDYLSYLYVSGNSFTAPANAKYVMFLFGNVVLDILVMLNEGSTTLPYEPYGKVWYITKNAIKYNVDTTQLTLKSNYTNIEYAEIPKPSNYAGYNSYDHTEIKYTNANWIEMSAGGWDLSNNIGKISGNADKLKWWVGFAKGTGLDNIKSELDGGYIIYPLATPTCIEITNTELIEDLETLYTAKSQEGTTNISITSENLPMIINASALKGED